jgi:hypothetical protein
MDPSANPKKQPLAGKPFTYIITCQYRSVPQNPMGAVGTEHLSIHLTKPCKGIQNPLSAPAIYLVLMSLD